MEVLELTLNSLNNTIEHLAESRHKLLAECIRSKTILGTLRPTKCTCDKVMVHYCDRCTIDGQIDALTQVIKEAKTK